MFETHNEAHVKPLNAWRYFLNIINTINRSSTDISHQTVSLFLHVIFHSRTNLKLLTEYLEFKYTSRVASFSLTFSFFSHQIFYVAAVFLSLCLSAGYHPNNLWAHQSVVSQQQQLKAGLWSDHSGFPVSLSLRSIWSQSFGRKLNKPPVNYLTYCCLRTDSLKKHQTAAEAPLKSKNDGNFTLWTGLVQKRIVYYCTYGYDFYL